jgi:hypothetical protein
MAGARRHSKLRGVDPRWSRHRWTRSGQFAPPQSRARLVCIALPLSRSVIRAFVAIALIDLDLWHGM